MPFTENPTDRLESKQRSTTPKKSQRFSRRGRWC
jgi:hypothetical protein